MDLVFVYGPPAVGKLTVAKHLSHLTGYGSFHNHLSFDIVQAFFEPFSKPFSKMLHDIRIKIFIAASECGASGAIFTMCYDHPGDSWIVNDINSTILRMGGRVYFVQLFCEKAELLRRVEQPSRTDFHKLTSPDKLIKTLDEWELFLPVQGFESYRIDNTNIPPEEVARLVKEHFELPQLNHQASDC